ncbi:MAG: hypothetical protein COA99_12655 [Moraxellaceae bacterium]|nr:MAG: hypothetical protein COA99_12655 [Moraxellaceae bacterium]
MGKYRSWGHYPATQQQGEHLPLDAQAFIKKNQTSLLPFGNGRSYGDVCLNPKGKVVDSNSQDCFLSFCPESGQIECQGGVLLADVLDLVIPKGWFLAVTPGTKYVTVGGAIANDVHGKNHHNMGSFGNHLSEFKLLRSNGDILNCSDNENSDYFSATIGGLGLTGIILSAKFQLMPLSNPDIIQETIRFENLKQFFKLASKSEQSNQYTVAWVDCLATGTHTGRGLFMRGNHSTAQQKHHPQLPELFPHYLVGYSLRRTPTLHGHSSTIHNNFPTTLHPVTLRSVTLNSEESLLLQPRKNSGSSMANHKEKGRNPLEFVTLAEVDASER